MVLGVVVAVGLQGTAREGEGGGGGGGVGAGGGVDKT